METIDIPEFHFLLEEAKWSRMRSKSASYWMQREAFANAILDRAKDRLTLYIDGVVYIPAEGGRRQLVECECGANYSDCWAECPLCGKRRALEQNAIDIEPSENQRRSNESGNSKC